MFGDKVYLKSLPKYGSHELFLFKESNERFFLKSRDFERLDERIFCLDVTNMGKERYKYSTYLHSFFSIIEDGEKTLIDGTLVETAKFYFNDDKNPIEFTILPPDQSGIEFRKLKDLFLEQEYLDEKERGGIFVKKWKSKDEENLRDLLGESIEIDFAAEADAIKCRGLKSVDGLIKLVQEDADYLAEFKNIKKIILDSTEDANPHFSLEENLLTIKHSKDFYNSSEATRDWLIENI